MACVTPEGKPTESGKKILNALKSGAASEEIAKTSGLPSIPSKKWTSRHGSSRFSERRRRKV